MDSESEEPGAQQPQQAAPANLQITDLELADGRIPFRDWYDGLRDRRAKAFIQTRLDRVQNGNLGDCKSVGKEVFEMRIFYGPGYRVYFAKVGAVIIVLLGGGDKSTQSGDITTAQTLWEHNKESVINATTGSS